MTPMMLSTSGLGIAALASGATFVGLLPIRLALVFFGIGAALLLAAGALLLTSP